MPYLTLSGGLPLQVPTDGTRNWGQTLKTNTWQKITDHDHTTGKGTAISTNALAANAVVGTKFRLANQEYLRALNAAGNSDLSLIKANASDLLEHSIGWTHLATNELKNRANAELVIRNTNSAAIGIYAANTTRTALFTGGGGSLLFDATSNAFLVKMSTTDAALSIAGGTSAAAGGGGHIRLYGHTHSSAPGRLELFAGSAGNVDIGSTGTGTGRWFHNNAVVWNISGDIVPETASVNSLGSETKPLAAVWSDEYNFTSIEDWEVTDPIDPEVRVLDTASWALLSTDGKLNHLRDVLGSLIQDLQVVGIIGTA